MHDSPAACSAARLTCCLRRPVVTRGLFALGVLAAAGAAPRAVRDVPSAPPAPLPARIVANDNRVAAGTLARGVLAVPLEIRDGRWYPGAEDGKSEVIPAFAVAGQPLQVPGPLLRVPAGTEVRATVRNTLDSALVVHGLRPGLPNDTLRMPARGAREVRYTMRTPGTLLLLGGGPGRAARAERRAHQPALGRAARRPTGRSAA